jgi:WD40 repeat protein
VTPPLGEVERGHKDDQGLQENLRNAVRGLAHGRGQISELTPGRLLAVLCGATFSPMIAAGFAAGVAGAEVSAMTGIASSVGSGVLGVVLVNAIDRLRERGKSAPPDAAEVEEQVIHNLEEALAADMESQVLQREIAEFFRDIDAGTIIAQSSEEPGNEVASSELAAALGRLGETFYDVGDALLGSMKGLTSRIDEMRLNQGEMSLDIQEIKELSAQSARFLEVFVEWFVRDPERRPDARLAAERRTLWARGSPYPGLRSFDEPDSPVFRGRETMTEELADQIAEGRPGGIVIVTGPSGAGKTSLLRAGLLPLLKRGVQVTGSDRWHRLVISPAGDPLGQLAQALAALAHRGRAEIRAELAERPGEANVVVQEAVNSHLLRHGQATGGGRMVLIVDQFEDAFGSASDEASVGQFISALGSAATIPAEGGGQPPAMIVIAIRGDFIDRCFSYDELRPAAQHLFIVEPMTDLEILDAIIGPAKYAGLSLQDGLVDLVLADVRAARRAGVLPLLSEAMRLTWEYREGSQLTMRGYRQSGGVSGAVQCTAEEVYESLGRAQQGLARDVLLAMTNVTEDSQSSRPVTRAELASRYPEEELDTVLGKLADGRLIVLDEDEVAIVHDALLGAWDRLRGWLEADRQIYIVHHQLKGRTAQWLKNREDRAYLYRGIELATLSQAISEWPERHMLAADEGRFLRASERAATRASRRQRLTAGVLATLLVVAVAGLLTAQRAASDANRQRTLAVSGQLAALSESLESANTNPSVAALLAAAAWDEAPGSAPAEESLLQVLARPVRAVLTAGGPIKALAFSPRGTLATAGKAIVFYQLGTNRRIGSPVAVPGGANGLAFNPGGTILATADGDGSARLWDVRTGRQIGPPIRASSGSGVNAVAFSPDGTVLATADGDGSARLWDVRTGREIGPALIDGGRVPRGSQVMDVAFSPGGRILATASLDGTARLWSATTWRQVGQTMTDARVHPPGAHQIFAVVFSPGGKTLATADQDGTVALWDVATQRRITVALTADGADGVAFSPNGAILAVAANNGLVALWDVETRSLIQPSLPSTTAGPTSVAAFGPGGAVLGTVSHNGVATLWDLAAFRNIAQPADVGGSNGLAFGSDGRSVATIGADGQVRIWNLSDSREVGKPIPVSETGGAAALAFSEDDQLLAIGGLDGKVRLWDRSAGRQAGRPIPVSTTSGVSAVAFSPDGKFLAIGDDDGSVQLWDARTGKSAGFLASSDSAGVSSLVFSPGGTRLAAVDDGGGLRLWDTVNHKADQYRFTVSVDAVAFSPNGQNLATADDDGTARLWSLATGLQFGAPMLTTDFGNATDVAFSPNGTFLATAGADGDAGVWDVATQHLIGPVIVGSSSGSNLDGVAFSPDGSALATVGAEGTAALWGVGFPRDLLGTVCAIAGRPLTRQEWSTYIQTAPYIKGCT